MANVSLAAKMQSILYHAPPPPVSEITEHAARSEMSASAHPYHLCLQRFIHNAYESMGQDGF